MPALTTAPGTSQGQDAIVVLPYSGRSQSLSESEIPLHGVDAKELVHGCQSSHDDIILIDSSSGLESSVSVHGKEGEALHLFL